jgi:hypothetical protein
VNIVEIDAGDLELRIITAVNVKLTITYNVTLCSVVLTNVSEEFVASTFGAKGKSSSVTYIVW